MSTILVGNASSKDYFLAEFAGFALLFAIPPAVPLPNGQSIFQVAVQYKSHFPQDRLSVPAGDMLAQGVCCFN
jgi:hypothetical protein